MARHRARVAAGCAIALLVLARLLPADGVGVPICWYRIAFGMRCPGCGLTRSLSCAVRGMWTESCGYHPLGIVVLIGLVGVAVSGILFSSVVGSLLRALLLRDDSKRTRPLGGG